jgi:hypothetical protein
MQLKIYAYVRGIADRSDEAVMSLLGNTPTLLR